MKKVFLIVLLLLVQICVLAAARFWVGGGSSANWNATGPTNWSATSGGSNNATVPGSGDDVTFDGAGSGNSASTISATITVLSLTFTSGFTNTVTMNATTTVAGNFTDNTAHTWAGTGGTLTISAASTITSGGKTFTQNVTFSGANTKTLSGDWTILGRLNISGATVINSNTINIASDLVVGAATSGTTLLNLTGGTWSGSSALSNSLTLSSGTIVSGLVSFNTGTLTSGAGVTTTGSTLSISGSATLNTNGTTWNNISTTVSGTITNNSLLTVAGTLNLFGVSTVTFAGSAGWTGGTINTLVHGVTYTVTTALTINAARISNPVTINSDSPGSQATLILQNGATCSCNANFTDISAAGGRTIFSFMGTVSNVTNILQFNDLKTVSKAFVL